MKKKVYPNFRNENIARIISVPINRESFKLLPTLDCCDPLACSQCSYMQCERVELKGMDKGVAPIPDGTVLPRFVCTNFNCNAQSVLTWTIIEEE